MRTRHVVTGVDGTTAAVRALDAAAREAARRDTDLEILYAVSDLDEAGPVLASAVSRVRGRHPGMPVTTTAVVGDPARALARRGRDAALTVVGSRGLGGLAGLLLGSVSLRLVAQAHGPLLLVRGEQAAGLAGPGHGEVILALGNGSDTDAAAYAFEEAARRGTRLRVLHTRACRPPLLAGTGAAIRRDGTNGEMPAWRVNTLLGPDSGPPRQRHRRLRRDVGATRSAAAHALIQATSGAGVVVATAGRRRRGTGLSPDPVTHALLRHSHCPVVLVPASR
ncbi:MULTISPECIES: universal stress protein [unclassified Streptomyces]|uniref:universal stress protein n=1 Tax=unclassified Streptomyces TaxID=2593676 RepID=UPI0015D50E95|nr:universal stress protein [Streptomyces sp. Ru87]